jgi:hypothetical protein
MKGTKDMANWINSKTEQPPKDRPFWAWCRDMGIHEMRWFTARENANAADDDDETKYIACYVGTRNDDVDYTPSFWCEHSDIEQPTS